MTALARLGSLRQARPTSLLIVALGLIGIVVISAVGHGHGDGHAHAGWQSSLHAALSAGSMMAAMMLPHAASAVSLVEERTLGRRRRRAVMEHAAGFASAWFIFGATAGLVLAPLAAILGNGMAYAALATLAIAWQLSHWRRTLMEREGALTTAPAWGWRADVGTLYAAAVDGTRCIKMCWPSMLALLAAPNLMVVVAWLPAYYYEWLPGPDPHGARRRLVPAVGYALAVFTVLVSAAQSEAAAAIAGWP